jgi:hypothetical protein
MPPTADSPQARTGDSKTPNHDPSKRSPNTAYAACAGLPIAACARCPIERSMVWRFRCEKRTATTSHGDYFGRWTRPCQVARRAAPALILRKLFEMEIAGQRTCGLPTVGKFLTREKAGALTYRAI